MTVCLSIRAWVSMFVQQRISETFIYEQLMNSAARSCIEVTSQNSHIRSLTVHKVPRKLKNLFSLILSCGTVKILKIKLEKQFWLIWYNLHLCFRKPSCKMSIDCRNFHSSHQTTNHLLNLNIKLILKIQIYKSQARLQEVTSFLGFFKTFPYQLTMIDAPLNPLTMILSLISSIFSLNSTNFEMMIGCLLKVRTPWQPRGTFCGLRKIWSGLKWKIMKIVLTKNLPELRAENASWCSIQGWVGV